MIVNLAIAIVREHPLQHIVVSLLLWYTEFMN